MAEYDEKDLKIKVDAEVTTDDTTTIEDVVEEIKDDMRTPMEQFFFHQRRALEETGKALEALLPPGFREHSTNASQEFARGFRILVDAAIDELKKVSEKDDPIANETPESDEDDDDDPPSSTGKTKVKVQVD